jgi:adenylate cyclase
VTPRRVPRRPGELIFRFEGTLERFARDGLMVSFNDPLAILEHAERAVRMAVAMRERVAELADGWQKLATSWGSEWPLDRAAAWADNGA